MPHEHGRPARTARAIRIPWWTTLVATAVAAAAIGCNESAGPGPSQSDRIDRTAPTTAPSADNPAVARINGLSVTRSDLDQVLYRAYGINMLADLVELDLAKQALAQKGLTLTDADVAAERQRSFAKMFESDPPDRWEQDFKQLKAEKHLTDAEFDLGFRTTAALRKVAHPQVAAQVTEASVRQAFGILYGENRRIADVELANVTEVAEAHRRLTNEPFDMVAKEMSLDKRTAGLGGEWPPFSTKTPGVPPVIMESAFALKVGEVSHDPIVDGDRFHVIKLLEVIPPKLVKYDDVKADVRRQVEDQVEQSFINQLRKQLQQITLQGLEIDDPTLRQSWDAMIAAQLPAGKTMSAADATAQIHAAERPPATMPAAAP